MDQPLDSALSEMTGLLMERQLPFAVMGGIHNIDWEYCVRLAEQLGEATDTDPTCLLHSARLEA